MAAAGKNRNAIFALKLALGIGLLGVIFSRIEIRDVVAQIHSASVGYLLLAVVFQLIAKIIWTSRWHTVLKLNDIHRGFWELFGIIHIGLFFNNFLPSSVGGDVIRGYYSSNSKDGLANSYGSLIIERTIGLLALALMVASAVSYAIVCGVLQSSDVMLMVAGVGSLVLFVFGALLLFWDGWHRLLFVIAKAFPKVSNILTDLSASLKTFRRANGYSQLMVILSSTALQVVAVYFYLACAK